MGWRNNMKKLTKQEQIAESIKRFREERHNRAIALELPNSIYVDFMKRSEDFLKQELEAIAEKTREDTAKEIFGTMDEWPLCRNIADNIERYTDFRDAFLSDKEK